MYTKVYFKVHRLEALYQQPVSPCLGAGGGGWAWYIQVMHCLLEGCITEAMYYEKFQYIIVLSADNVPPAKACTAFECTGSICTCQWEGLGLFHLL